MKKYSEAPLSPFAHTLSLRLAVSIYFIESSFFPRSEGRLKVNKVRSMLKIKRKEIC